MYISNQEKKKKKNPPEHARWALRGGGAGAGAGTTPGPDPIMLKMDYVDEKKNENFPRSSLRVFGAGCTLKIG